MGLLDFAEMKSESDLMQSRPRIDAAPLHPYQLAQFSAGAIANTMAKERERLRALGALADRAPSERRRVESTKGHTNEGKVGRQLMRKSVGCRRVHDLIPARRHSLHD